MSSRYSASHKKGKQSRPSSPSGGRGRSKEPESASAKRAASRARKSAYDDPSVSVMDALSNLSISSASAASSQKMSREKWEEHKEKMKARRLRTLDVPRRYFSEIMDEILADAVNPRVYNLNVVVPKDKFLVISTPSTDFMSGTAAVFNGLMVSIVTLKFTAVLDGNGYDANVKSYQVERRIILLPADLLDFPINDHKKLKEFMESGNKKAALLTEHKIIPLNFRPHPASIGSEYIHRYGMDIQIRCMEMVTRALNMFETVAKVKPFAHKSASEKAMRAFLPYLTGVVSKGNTPEENHTAFMKQKQKLLDALKADGLASSDASPFVGYPMLPSEEYTKNFKKYNHDSWMHTPDYEMPVRGFSSICKDPDFSTERDSDSDSD